MVAEQNKLEQLFIPKNKKEYANFSNSRPITKTSPIYKILDKILNERLWRELNNNVT